MENIYSTLTVTTITCFFVAGVMCSLYEINSCCLFRFVFNVICVLFQ